MNNTIMFTGIFGLLFTFLIVAIIGLMSTLWKDERKWFYIVIIVVPVAVFIAWHVRPQ